MKSCYCLAAGLLPLIPLAEAQTLRISDSFSTAGLLNGSTPDITVSGGSWLAATGPFAPTSDGDTLAFPTSAVHTAWIDLGSAYFLSNPGVYILSADIGFAANATPATNWVGLGFATSTATYGNFTVGGTPWVLYRENGNVRAFAGSGVSNSLFSEGTYHFENGTYYQLAVVLDTSASPWTVEAYVDGQPLDLNGSADAYAYTFSSSPTTARYVGLSSTTTSDAPLGMVDNFRLALGLPAPTLADPANLSSDYQLSPSYFWQAVSDASAYEIQISASSSFSSLLDHDIIEVERYVPKDGLPPGNTYWRVRALDANGHPGAWSSTRQHTIATPASTYTVTDTATWVDDLRTWVAGNTGPIQIVFTPDTYSFVPSEHPADDYVLMLFNRQDIVIDGQGSTILFDSATVPNNNVGGGATTHVIPGFIHLQNCEDITVRRFTFEHLTPPHSVNEVLAITNPSGNVARFRLQAESGYPALDSVTLQDHWEDASILDPDPARRGLLKPLAGNRYLFSKSTLTPVSGSPGQFTVDAQIPYSSVVNQVAVGDRVIFYARNGNVFNTVNLVQSRDTVFEELTIHTTPWGHFWSWYGSELKVLDCDLVRASSSAWFAGNADGVHSRAAEVGPWVEGCTFAGTGDDGVALYNKGMSIIQHYRPTDSNRVRIVGDNLHLSTGDQFTIFHATGGTLDPTSYAVTGISPSGTNAYEVTFTPALTYDPYIAGTTSSYLRLNDQLFSQNERNGGFVVRGNTFAGNRRYGTITRAPNGLIADNVYTGSSAAAIVLLNEATSFQNGLESTDVQILRNTLDGNGFDSSAQAYGAIHVEFWAADPANGVSHLGSTARAHSLIRIADNVISNWSRSAILLANADDSTVRNNRVNSRRLPAFFPSVTDQAVVLKNTDDSVVTGNDLSASGVATVNALVIPAATNTNVTKADNLLP